MTAYVKYAIVSIVQGGMTFYRPFSIAAYNPENLEQILQLQLSFLFGLLMVGNIIDNLHHLKWLAVSGELALGLIWIAQGFIFSETTHSSLLYTGQMVGTYTIVINILQIYNWFSHRQLCRVLAIFLSAELIGYLFDFYIEQYYNWLNFTFGGVFILFALIDIFYFHFGPEKLGINIDHKSVVVEEVDL